jgi:hypothetical protein
MNERNLKNLISNHQYDPAKPPRPDEIVAQLKEARAQIGCGVVDLLFQTPGSEHPDQLMEALELFGKKVLPHVRDI